jgi:hypothetical protein
VCISATYISQCDILCTHWVYQIVYGGLPDVGPFLLECYPELADTTRNPGHTYLECPKFILWATYPANTKFIPTSDHFELRETGCRSQKYKDGRYMCIMLECNVMLSDKRQYS